MYAVPTMPSFALTTALRQIPGAANPTRCPVRRTRPTRICPEAMRRCPTVPALRGATWLRSPLQHRYWPADGSLPRDKLTAMARRIPDCELHVLDAGHQLHEDRPVEFVAALSKFLGTERVEVGLLHSCSATADWERRPGARPAGDRQPEPSAIGETGSWRAAAYAAGFPPIMID